MKLPLIVLTTTLVCQISSCGSTHSQSKFADVQDTKSYFSYFTNPFPKEWTINQAFPNQLSANTSIFSVSPIAWATLLGNYGYNVRHADQDSFIRTDAWRIGANVNVGDVVRLATGQTMPVTLGFSPNSNIEFSRIYDDRKHAMLALPKLPNELPLTANKALHLNYGDFVSMPVSMGLNLGVTSRSATAVVGAAAEAGLFWFGEFRINVYRHADQLVRLKVSPVQEYGDYGAVGTLMDLNIFGYDPTHLVNLDHQVVNLLGLGFFKIVNRHIWNSDRYTWDYVFNLADPAAADAFTKLLSRPISLLAKYWELVPGRFAGKAFVDLGEVESIVSQDAALPSGSRRIERLIGGIDQSSGTNLTFRLGTQILKNTAERSTMFHKIEVLPDTNTNDPEAENEFFLYPMYRHARQTDSWISPFKASDHISTTAAIAMDRQTNQPNAVSLVFNRQVRQRVIDPVEGAKIRADLAAMFGPAEFDKRLDAYLPKSGTYSSFRLDIRMGWDDQMLDQWSRLSRQNPDLFEAKLWQIIADITPQLSGRAGTGSAVPPTNPWFLPEYLLSLSIQEVRTTARSILHLRWDGVRGRIASDLVESTKNIARTGSSEYTLRLMHILSTDYSAEEIIPAFLHAAGHAFKTPGFAQVKLYRDGAPDKTYESGEMHREELQKKLAESFRLMTHLGYELNGSNR